jgi:hypothetical protein
LSASQDGPYGSGDASSVTEGSGSGAVLGVEAAGTLTAEDYTTVLAPALAAATKDRGKIRIVLLFTGEFDGMEPGAVWQDLKTDIRDPGSGSRWSSTTRG